MLTTVTDRPKVEARGATAQSDRGALTSDERGAMRRRLKALASLEESRVQRIAAVGVDPIAAYDIGIRFAVHDALAKLAGGMYGDCETCRHAIPLTRLQEVPYARRCATCQEREERGWDQVQRLVGCVVRRLAGEPQGRPM